MAQKKKKRLLYGILILCLLLLLLLLWGNRPKPFGGSMGSGEPVVADSMTSDTVSRTWGVDTATDSAVMATPPGPAGAGPAKRVDSIPARRREDRPDSTRQMHPRNRLPDNPPEDTVSLEPEIDTVAVDPCVADTVAPWVYPDPSGGLHYAPVVVRLVADDSCRIEFRRDTRSPWREYDATPVRIEESGTLWYRAVDSCGNRMAPHREEYEIVFRKPTARCPESMTFIEIGESRFCIDKYEWPNRRGERVRTYVSVYEAMDSCFSVGKRLCTSDEWKLACGGPYGWNYPYGRDYEPRACVTRDTSSTRAGERRECRGYFEVYDLSGNVMEWTKTKSRENPRFFNIMGGFYRSGPQSGCFDVRYSYFPQNRHTPVGFRCCADATSENK